jgi:hypothetical protein
VYFRAFGLKVMTESTEFAFSAVAFVVVEAFLFFVGGGYYFGSGVLFVFFLFSFLFDFVRFQVD